MLDISDHARVEFETEIHFAKRADVQKEDSNEFEYTFELALSIERQKLGSFIDFARTQNGELWVRIPCIAYEGVLRRMILLQKALHEEIRPSFPLLIPAKEAKGSV